MANSSASKSEGNKDKQGNKPSITYECENYFKPDFYANRKLVSASLNFGIGKSYTANGSSCNVDVKIGNDTIAQQKSVIPNPSFGSSVTETNSSVTVDINIKYFNNDWSLTGNLVFYCYPPTLGPTTNSMFYGIYHPKITYYFKEGRTLTLNLGVGCTKVYSVIDGTKIESTSTQTRYMYDDDILEIGANGAAGYQWGNWNGQTSTTNPTTNITVGSNLSYTANFNPISYKISYNANGGTGSMADTATTFGTATVLRPNSFSSPKYNVNLNVNGGNLNQTNYSLDRTFLGWQDTGSITAYNGEEFTYLQFDAPYYANANIDVYDWAGGYHKYNLIYHYVASGRNEGRNPIDPNKKPGYYPNQATVTSLTTNDGYTVPLLAGWGSAQLILPTPTRKYHEFLGWDDGTFIYPAGYNLEINSNNTILTARWKKNHYRAFVGIDDLQDMCIGKNKKISRIFLGIDEI